MNYGYGRFGVDFLTQSEPVDADIITNPPYAQAQAFVEHAISLLTKGHLTFRFSVQCCLSGKLNIRVPAAAMTALQIGAPDNLIVLTLIW